VWSGGAEREIPRILEALSDDRQNRVAILAGTGSTFCTASDSASFGARDSEGYWDGISQRGAAIIWSFTRCRIPLIAAVNGPATVHAELPMLCDLVVASEDAYFADTMHLERGVVPGDGAHVVWPLLLGIGRARHFLLTGGELSSNEAMRLGLVHAVTGRDDVLDEATRLAEQLAQRSRDALSATRRLIWRELERRLVSDLDLGFALEGSALQL
jgi:enoyl-CoA hydratase/carnithine racemase